jgi:hypothetical protein
VIALFASSQGLWAQSNERQTANAPKRPSDPYQRTNETRSVSQKTPSHADKAYVIDAAADYQLFVPSYMSPKESIEASRQGISTKEIPEESMDLKSSNKSLLKTDKLDITFNIYNYDRSTKLSLGFDLKEELRKSSTSSGSPFEASNLFLLPRFDSYGYEPTLWDKERDGIISKAAISGELSPSLGLSIGRNSVRQGGLAVKDEGLISSVYSSHFLPFYRNEMTIEGVWQTPGQSLSIQFIQNNKQRREMTRRAYLRNEIEEGLDTNSISDKVYKNAPSSLSPVHNDKLSSQGVCAEFVKNLNILEATAQGGLFNANKSYFLSLGSKFKLGPVNAMINSLYDQTDGEIDDEATKIADDLVYDLRLSIKLGSWIPFAEASFVKRKEKISNEIYLASRENSQTLGVLLDRTDKSFMPFLSLSGYNYSQIYSIAERPTLDELSFKLKDTFINVGIRGEIK